MSQRIPVPPAPLTLMRRLDRHAREKPQAIAFRFIRSPDFSSDDLSFAALRARALGIAQALRQRHAEGSRVLLVLPPGLDYIASFLGCLYAGAIAVPIYPPRRNRPPERFATVALNSTARFAIARPDVRQQIESTLSPTLLRDIDLTWLTPDGELGNGEAWALPYVDTDTPAFLQYTSGSTAEPKGVVVTHGSLAHNISLLEEPFDMAAADVLALSWLPPFHDLGLIGNLLAAVHHGVTEVLMSPQAFLGDPLSWLRAISHFRATASAAPNFAYDLCASRATPAALETIDLHCWKTAFNGAEPIMPATLERFARTFAPCGFSPNAFCPGYGLAEATLVVSAQRRGTGAIVAGFDREELRQHRVQPTDDSARGTRLVGSGVVLGGTEAIATTSEGKNGSAMNSRPHRVLIVDPDTRRLCAPNAVGEIWVSSPSVAPGYWANSEATRETFRARLQPAGEGPFLRTGDLGFLHAGQLFVAGRRKDLIIIGGTNHYPQDIELTARAAHPALAEAAGAAFSIMSDDGETLAVVHEINLQHRSADFPAVAAALRSTISETHQLAVTHFALVRFASLPKTSSGKIQRNRCRELFLAGGLDAYITTQTETARVALPAPGVGESPLSSDDFKRLHAGIARILAITSATLDPDAPLLQQGMSSLRAVELQCFLEAEFGCRLDYEDFFEPWSVRRLAALIHEKNSKGVGLPNSAAI
jgi:acyl-CoA synthetase (AMP-forming)/AMP-acid ligase II/acyl carrier protein